MGTQKIMKFALHPGKGRKAEGPRRTRRAARAEWQRAMAHALAEQERLHSDRRSDHTLTI